MRDHSITPAFLVPVEAHQRIAHETADGAACNAIDLNAADLCPDTLDMSPCDMSPYYKCMADAVKCNGDFLDISGQSNCTMPSCN